MSEHGLAEYLVEDRDYIIYVGLPADRPSQWVQVVHYTQDLVVTRDGQRVPVGDVSSCIVAYAHGSILHVSNPCAPLPPDIDFGGQRKSEQDSLRLSDLKAGLELATVTHGPLTPRKDSGSYDHVTTLTNISKQKIRVLQFGAYGRRGKDYIRGNIGDAFFTAQEFRSWYGQKGEWILPGESVADLHNYSSVGALWAYYFETKSGRQLITGKIVGIIDI